MVRLSISDEKVFGDLQKRLYDLVQLLSPTTERFVPIDEVLRRLQERLSHYDPTLRLLVVGHPESGKSTFLNAITGKYLLPEHTPKEIEIFPFDGDCLIRRGDGKAIAIGEESVRAHLLSECQTVLPELSQRRLLTRMPLISPPLCYAGSWVLVDTTPKTTALMPKLSSVGSRIYSPNILAGDCIFYCVDSTLMGKPGEEECFSYLTGSLKVSKTFLQRLLDRTVFVLTKSDVISEAEERIERIQRIEPPAITSLQEVREHFLSLAEKVLGLPLRDEQVLQVSARNALTSKIILEQEKPDINEVYNYCEQVYGSVFMQTIDNIPENDLYGIVHNHCRGEGARKSQLYKMDDCIRLIDFNYGRHLMAAICSTGAECCEQLMDALEEAAPAIEVQIQEDRDELDHLTTELEWLVHASDTVELTVNKISQSLLDLVNTELDNFFSRRMEELQYVMEHKELYWYKQRQSCTIVEMNSSLRRLETFIARYLREMTYLKQKFGTAGFSAFGAEDSTNTPGGAEEETTQTMFLRENYESLTKIMEKEKLERLVDFGTSFCHHLKDEFNLFLDEFLEKVETKKNALIQELLDVTADSITLSEKRCNVLFDWEESPLVQFRELQLVEKNPRRLNNFLRDLPEHVATAAVELSLQQQPTLFNNNNNNEALWAGSSISEASERPSVTSLDNTSARGIDSSRPFGGTTTREENSAGAVTEVPSIKDFEKKLEGPICTGEDLRGAMKFVEDSWQLALQSVGIHQLTNFHVHSLDEILQQLNLSIIAHIRRYSDSLDEGIKAQRVLIATGAKERQETIDVRKAADPMVGQFRAILKELDSMTIRDAEEASRVAAVESAKK